MGIGIITISESNSEEAIYHAKYNIPATNFYRLCLWIFTGIIGYCWIKTFNERHPQEAIGDEATQKVIKRTERTGSPRSCGTRDDDVMML